MLNELNDENQNILKSKKVKEAQCVMNRLRIFNERDAYLSYTCNGCPGKPDNICQFCFETCHRNHNISTKNVNERKQYIKKTICSCAINDHIVQISETQIDKIRTDTQDMQCTLNEVLHCSNMNSYYMDPTTHMYFCIFCLDSCLGIYNPNSTPNSKEDSLKDYIKKEKTKFANGAPLCSCGNKDNHSPFFENIQCLIQLLLTNNYDKYFNKLQIPSQILSKTQLIEKYLESIKHNHSEIMKSIKENTFYKYQKEQMPKVYTYSLKLVKTFSEVFNKDNYYISNPNIVNTYNIDFMITLFSQSNDPFLCDTKVNCLIFYRKFYMIPLMKSKRWHQAYIDFENLTPFHRLMFRNNISELFLAIKTERKIFMQLLSKVHITIFKYNEKLDEKSLSILIIEYLKWLIYVVSFKFTDPNDIVLVYNVILEKFTKLVNLIQPRKYFDVVKKYIEMFVARVIINTNDEIFYNKVFPHSNSSILKKTAMKSLNLITNNNFRALIEEDEHSSNFGNFGNDHNNNIPNDIINTRFAFEDGDLQMNMIKNLFAFKKEESDHSKELQNGELYDILVNKEDFYFINIKSLLESKYMRIINDNAETLPMKAFFNPVKDINIDAFFPNKEIYDQLRDNMENLEDNKKKFYDSSINETLFFDNCKLSIVTIKSILSKFIFINVDTLLTEENNLINSSQQTTYKELFYKQNFLFKMGLFDILLNIYYIYSSSNFLKYNLGEKKVVLILSECIDIFKQLTACNPFLASLFFNSNILQYVVFEQERDREGQREREKERELDKMQEKSKSMENQTQRHNLHDENDILRSIHDKEKDKKNQINLIIFDINNTSFIKNFYLENLKCLLKQNYKLDLVKYIQLIDDDLSILLKSEKSENENIKEINLILKNFNKCLNVNSSKTLHKANSIIATKLKEILESDLFKNLIQDFKSKMNNQIDEYKSELSHENLKQFILLVFKCINNLQDNYFYLLTDYININQVEEIFKSNGDMDPIGKRIITKVYDKFYIQSPFHIFKNFSKEEMRYMDNQVDINLIGRIRYSDKDDKVLQPLMKKIRLNILADMKINLQEKEKVEIKNKFDKNEEYIHTILLNMEKYKKQVKLYNNYFKNNYKLFFKYFQDIILNPTVYAIYKILYFSETIPAKYKYLIYKIIYLFLECFRFFLSMITVDTMKLLTEDSERIFKRFFIFTKSNMDMREYIRSITDELNIDIDRMNGVNFEGLNLKLLMTIWKKHISKMRILNTNDALNNSSSTKTLKDSNSSPNIINTNDISHKIKNFALEYLERKSERENLVMVKLFSLDGGEDNMHIDDVKKTIALDLLFRIKGEADKYSITIFNEDNTMVLETVNILFKVNPDFWQSILTCTSSWMKKQIFSLIRSHITYLFQFIFIDFHKLTIIPNNHNLNEFKIQQDDSANSHFKSNFINVIEFLRLFCENHNKIYQTLLINIYITYGELDLIDFMLKLPILIVNNVKYFKKKKEIVKFFKVSKAEYFYELNENITNYLIEIIQGSFSINLKKINNSHSFTNYYETLYRYFDSVEQDEEYEIFLSHFMFFLNCYLEENSNAIENKTVIIKKINPKKFLHVLTHSFKKLYLVEYEKKNMKDFFTLQVPERSHENLINYFITEESFSECELFKLSSNIYKYLKTAILWKSGEKALKIFDNLKKLSDMETIPDKNRAQILLKREMYKFFETVIKEVEVSYKFKEIMEELELNKFKDYFEDDFCEFDRIRQDIKVELQGIQKVVYLAHPDSLFIQPNDIYNFNENAPFDNFNTKLNYILAYYTTILDTVQLRRILWNVDSKILNFLFTLNYQIALNFSIILALIVNIIMLFSTSLEAKKEHLFVHTKAQGRSLRTITAAHPVIPQEVTLLDIMKSKDFKEAAYYIIEQLALFHIIILVFLIVNWLAFAVIKLNKFSHKRKEYSLYEKVIHYLQLLMHKEIFPFIWNLLFGLIAMSKKDYFFIFSLQLFTIFNLFPTMQSVIYSVRVRYKQFLSAGLLITIIILFYSSISFYLLRNEFYNSDLDENICSSFLHCFSTLITNGIRAGSGLGFSVKPFSSSLYFPEFIFEWIFYFSIILIMLNVINGIIVDTFQALREQNNLKEDIKANVCYICSLNRSKFEVKGLNFTDHTNIEHNVLNYFYYMFKIQLTDEQDLNSLDYQVLNSIRDTRTDFFPVKKALSLYAN